MLIKNNSENNKLTISQEHCRLGADWYEFNQRVIDSSADFDKHQSPSGDNKPEDPGPLLRNIKSASKLWKTEYINLQVDPKKVQNLKKQNKKLDLTTFVLKHVVRTSTRSLQLYS